MSQYMRLTLCLAQYALLVYSTANIITLVLVGIPPCVEDIGPLTMATSPQLRSLTGVLQNSLYWSLCTFHSCSHRHLVLWRTLLKSLCFNIHAHQGDKNPPSLSKVFITLSGLPLTSRRTLPSCQTNTLFGNVLIYTQQTPQQTQSPSQDSAGSLWCCLGIPDDGDENFFNETMIQ